VKPQAADGYASMASAYVHIPFCSAVCPYCDFAVVAGQDELAGRYIRAVCTEIQEARPWRPLDAVYFGGGTPSRIDPSLLADVLGALDEKHGIADGAEVSLEANPEDFATTRARRLLDAGFNRVSWS
jgi:oxygen-independent coproporphyrinogen-3 oxidase